MSNLKFYSVIGLSVALVGSISVDLYLHGKNKSTPVSASPTVIPASAAVSAASIHKLSTLKGFELVHPLLSSQQAEEAPEFEPMKTGIATIIEDSKRVGIVSNASVYVFSLNDGKWMYLNPNEAFNPGSLLKVPVLMTLLRMSESNPAFLSKRITFSNNVKIPTQTYQTTSIQPGNSYSVKELLRYMAAYSDNNATRLLNESLTQSDVIKTFTDLSQPEPRLTDWNYQISAKQISDFFIVLYYANYLSKVNSELAMELLAECNFKDGLSKNLPPTMKMAHKFGEWGDNRSGMHEMGESGVVYMDNKPYLITVMTKGQNSRDLATVLSKISKLVYDNFSASKSL